MFARTSTWSGSPEALQKWADNAVSTVRGFVEGLPGNAGAVFLVDRDGGTALTLTLWDSDDAARATAQFAERSRAATVASTGTELVSRGSYEVVAPG
jgi:heme-degrading monooxygenase HmoA